MAPTLRISLFVLFALCRWCDVATGASLQSPQQTSVQLTQSAPGTVVVTPATAVSLIVKEDLDDLIEDPAFIEELLKNMHPDTDNDTMSAEIDDITDDVDNNSTEADSKDTTSSKEEQDEVDTQDDQDDGVLFHVLHDADTDNDNSDDVEATSSEAADSQEEVSMGGASVGSSFSAEDNDLFDILYEEDDDQWTKSQLAKMGKLHAMPGQCPVYPVNIEATQITIDTQDGCQIVIELSGQTVKKVSTMTDGEVKMKRMLSNTRVTFLANDDASEDDSEATDDTSNPDEAITDDKDDDKLTEDSTDNSEVNDKDKDELEHGDDVHSSTEMDETSNKSTDDMATN